MRVIERRLVSGWMANGQLAPISTQWIVNPYLIAFIITIITALVVR